MFIDIQWIEKENMLTSTKDQNKSKYFENYTKYRKLEKIWKFQFWCVIITTILFHDCFFFQFGTFC